MINETSIRQRLAHMDVGQSVYWPHECHASGRPSLQITRETSGWFAYCHRCHESKRVQLQEYARPVKRKTPKKNNNLPDCSIKGISDRTLWPADMVAFTRWITQDEIAKYGIEYVPERSMLKLPVPGAGCVYRMNNPKRYLSNLRRKGTVFAAGNAENPSLAVLTEDILSAIVVAETAEQTEMPVVALAQLTVGVKTDTVDFLVDKKIKKCLVWFDNDNSQVRCEQRKALRKLQGIGILTRVVLDYPGTDPKEMPREQIRAVLRDFLGKLVSE